MHLLPLSRQYNVVEEVTKLNSSASIGHQAIASASSTRDDADLRRTMLQRQNSARESIATCDTEEPLLPCHAVDLLELWRDRWFGINKPLRRHRSERTASRRPPRINKRTIAGNASSSLPLDNSSASDSSSSTELITTPKRGLFSWNQLSDPHPTPNAEEIQRQSAIIQELPGIGTWAGRQRLFTRPAPIVPSLQPQDVHTPELLDPISHLPLNDTLGNRTSSDNNRMIVGFPPPLPPPETIIRHSKELKTTTTINNEPSSSSAAAAAPAASLRQHHPAVEKHGYHNIHQHSTNQHTDPSLRTAPSNTSEDFQNDAWRWRFSLKWQAEQKKALQQDPDNPDTLHDSELDAIEYIQGCGIGVNLQLTNTTPLRAQHGSAIASPSPSQSTVRPAHGNGVHRNKKERTKKKERKNASFPSNGVPTMISYDAPAMLLPTTAAVADKSNYSTAMEPDTALHHPSTTTTTTTTTTAAKNNTKKTATNGSIEIPGHPPHHRSLFLHQPQIFPSGSTASTMQFEVDPSFVSLDMMGTEESIGSFSSSCATTQGGPSQHGGSFAYAQLVQQQHHGEEGLVRYGTGVNGLENGLGPDNVLQADGNASSRPLETTESPSSVTVTDTVAGDYVGAGKKGKAKPRKHHAAPLAAKRNNKHVPLATSELLTVIDKGRELMQKQRELESRAAALWEQSCAAGPPWAGTYVTPVQIDMYGRFPYVIIRIVEPSGGRQRYLVRGQKGIKRDELMRSTAAEAAAVCAAHTVSMPVVEFVGGGWMEWRQDTERHLIVSQGRGVAHLDGLSNTGVHGGTRGGVGSSRVGMNGTISGGGGGDSAGVRGGTGQQTSGSPSDSSMCSDVSGLAISLVRQILPCHFRITSSS